MQEYKLTVPQQQIYDASKFSANTAFTLCGYVIFDNGISPDTLNFAVNELYKRNDALRIKITNGTKATQIIEEYRYKETDFAEFDNTDELNAFACKFALQPLSLFGDLSKFTVFTADGKTGILLKIHHIISDGWSVNLLVKQLLCILEGKSFDTPSFIDAVKKEEEYLQSEKYKRDKKFFTDVTEKQKNRPLLAEETSSFFACQSEYEIPDSVKLKVNAYCEKNGITPAVFWLSCYSLVLGKRMNCAEDFFIGVPALNRVTASELNTVGMFANNIPVLMHFDYEKSFIENAADNIENSFYNALRHQKYNYGELMHSSVNNKGRLFDVIFSYMPRQSENEIFGKINQVFCQNQIESLQIHMDETAGKIYYSYKNEIFSPCTITYFHDAVMLAAETALSGADIKAGDFCIVSDRELNEINSINNTCVPLAENCGIYDVFDNTCRENLDNTCIITDGREYSFSGFEKLIRLTDAEIRQSLSGTQNVVAVYCNRSIEMYVSIYAVLRSGNIFLPISPDYPKEYTEYILSNSGAVLLLTNEEFSDKTQTFSVKTLNVTDIINGGSISEELPIMHGETAYILYTSGSTGKPKGAVIRNDALLNRIVWMQNRYKLSNGDVILQKTPYTFDVSLWEIFLPAASGAQMAVLSPYEHYLPQKILADISKYKVTHIHFVPSVFENMLQYLQTNPQDVKTLASLKHIFFSGEALNSSTVSKFKNICSDKIKIHNLYGPTECAIDVTYYDCTGDETEIPIGKPIDNVSAYIVSDRLERVPFGVMGQLALGGICVGKEYVNDTEKTKEKFVKNPFGEGMMFLTGDTVYLREDKNIMFLGRRDTQVKINGQRIELFAIENAIGLHNAVKSAAVIPYNDGKKVILRAFYTGEFVPPEELYRFVKSKLPAYMVPHTWNYIKELPLTAHGKTDVNALLSIPAETVGTLQEPPQTELEKQVAGIFKKLLNTENIGRYDDFFSLGGTSLDMATLLSDGILSDITVFEFMQDASPYGIAKLLEGEKQEREGVFVSLNKPENTADVLVVFPFAGGNLSSFSALINLIKKRYPHVAVIGPEKAFDGKNIKSAAKEIIAISKNHTVRFYSHCAGMASAAALLGEIEKTNTNAVTEYVATALIPPVSLNGRVKSVWKKLPDFVIEKVLLHAGMPKISKDAKKDLIADFRKDTDYFAEVLSKSEGKKIACPVRVLISKNDIFTKNIKSAQRNWEAYFGLVKEIKTAEYNTHYFQSENASDVADFILGQ